MDREVRCLHSGAQWRGDRHLKDSRACLGEVASLGRGVRIPDTAGLASRGTEREALAPREHISDSASLKVQNHNNVKEFTGLRESRAVVPSGSLAYL